MNNAGTTIRRYDCSKMPQEVWDKYGVVLLITPIFIYAIDKIYQLADNVMKNNYSLTLSYDDFQMKLSKEEKTSYQ